MTTIDKTSLKPVIGRLKEEGFTLLTSIICTEVQNGFEITYTLYNQGENASVSLKIFTTRDIDSITDIFKSAEYDEREIFDLFGVKFTNHPNLKRILMPECWRGNPLKKNYKFEDERLAWNN